MKKLFIVMTTTLLLLGILTACSNATAGVEVAASDSHKQAILVVSFGTSYNDTRALTLDAIEAEITMTFPDYEVRRAFTSQFIIDKLASRDGLIIDNVDSAMQRLVKDGFDKLIVQPTHVMNGLEYDEMMAQIEPYSEKFAKIAYAKPLLTSTEDYKNLVKAVTAEMPKLKSGEGIVWMGHGTNHYVNTTYAALDYMFKNQGFRNNYVGTVESFPEINDVKALLVEDKIEKVYLLPLMIVAGDHASNDMVGDEEDSWKNQLIAEGFEVEPIIKGLGEYAGIRAIYVDHVTAAIESIEEASVKTMATDASEMISFKDDDGREVNLAKPSQRIISLYSAHTENLYSLGAGDKIIGGHKTCIYPAEAAAKEVYDYNGDPEKVIAAEPDLVLIRPFIARKSPDFVEALENAGILVVSLYPESFADFDDYIEKLALLTTTEVKAEALLKEFHQKLDNIAKITSHVNQEEKQGIFFEATEMNLRTVTPDSLVAQAIVLAGGENLAIDAQPISQGSSIATFGAEKILALADEIDVYVAQQGAMNAGINLENILKRPGFKTIKAVQDKRVYLINEKLISSPTFRYYEGAKQLACYLYPDMSNDLSI